MKFKLDFHRGAPRGVSRIESGDTLILYSSQERMMDLINRRADMIGNLQHVMAVTKQLDVIEAEEEAQDPNHQIDTES